MGGIWVSRIELIGTTSEIVGYKSGLALTREELSRFIPPSCEDYWFGPDDAIIRIRSDEFESIISAMLYGIGNIPTPDAKFLTVDTLLKYRKDRRCRKIAEDLFRRFTRFLEQSVEAAKTGQTRVVDPTPFIISASMGYGVRGAKIATEFVEAFGLMLHVNPWGNKYRRIEWKDIAELRDLFESESIRPAHGTFFDQRFVDFLHKNFEKIDEINWRKFEALTCEFFDRAGFRVKIGEGRGDDNIDARVWPRTAREGLPPAILVQCKREKRKIGKVVVKALYADIVDERAGSGLVVTTTSLSPGAEQVCVARGYPIQQADRGTLRQWLAAMRTPHRGVFLAA